MNNFKIILRTLLVLVLIIGFSVSLYAEADDRDRDLIGRVYLDRSDPILRINQDFVPMDRAAEELDFDLRWEFKDDQVNGKIGEFYFSTSDYIIYQDKLYVKEEMFDSDLGLIGEIRGARVYFYRNVRKTGDNQLKLDVNTNTTSLSKKDPLAVSILLRNISGSDLQIRFRSGKRYDLVIERNGREVWRLSDGRAYTQSIIEKELDKGEYFLFTNLIQPDLERGRYTLFAEVRTTGTSLKSEPINLVVR